MLDSEGLANLQFGKTCLKVEPQVQYKQTTLLTTTEIFHARDDES